MPHPKETSDRSETKTGEPQVRSTFLRQEATLCQWPEDFVPAIDADDPATRALAETLWDETRPILEARRERLSRQAFNTALERATSEVFSHSGVGIKQLAAAKQALQGTWEQIRSTCEMRPAPIEEPLGERPVLTAKLESTPAGAITQAPGTARISLAVGDYALAVEVNVPPQSWLFKAYSRAREGLMRAIETRQLSESSRLGGVTDDRELTMGLRYLRPPGVVEVGTFRSRKNR